MWRAFFLAIGISLCILGGECLVLDQAVLAAPIKAAKPGSEGQPDSNIGGIREISPPEWAPWTLMSAGAVVILYSFTIPRRVAG